MEIIPGLFKAVVVKFKISRIYPPPPVTPWDPRLSEDRNLDAETSSPSFISGSTRLVFTLGLGVGHFHVQFIQSLQSNRKIRWFVRLRITKLNRTTYIYLWVWNLSSFGGKIRQMNIQLVRENLDCRKSARYAPPQACGKINQKYLCLLFYLRLRCLCCGFIAIYFGFCSYKLEFYHECLSVSQKARIKFYFDQTAILFYVKQEYMLTYCPTTQNTKDTPRPQLPYMKVKG